MGLCALAVGALSVVGYRSSISGRIYALTVSVQERKMLHHPSTAFC